MSRKLEPSDFMEADAGLICRPLTPERWSDFEQLFGKRGACGDALVRRHGQPDRPFLVRRKCLRLRQDELARLDAQAGRHRCDLQPAAGLRQVVPVNGLLERRVRQLKMQRQFGRLTGFQDGGLLPNADVQVGQFDRRVSFDGRV